MHHAKLHRSPRLQRVLRLLSDCREHSTREIIRGADVCAVNSCIAELRENGIAVASRVEDGIWYYRLGRKERPRIRAGQVAAKPLPDALPARAEA
jgi:biotin operon repressor